MKVRFLLPFALSMIGMLAGCGVFKKDDPEPAAKAVEPVRIGHMRPEMTNDAYWAFCTPDCPPPTPKARMPVNTKPVTPKPGQAIQVR